MLFHISSLTFLNKILRVIEYVPEFLSSLIFDIRDLLARNLFLKNLTGQIYSLKRSFVELLIL